MKNATIPILIEADSPIGNHSTKPISRSRFSLKNPAKIIFGGVPIKVAIPPIFAAQATDKSKGLSTFTDTFLGKTANTLVTMGSIIIEVAVLLIHMDIKPVLSMKPANKPLPSVPVLRKIHRAIR